LDVVVTDGRCRPVIGLTKSDFILSENGVRQTLIGVVERNAVLRASEPPTTHFQNTFQVHPAVTGEGAVVVVLLNYLSQVDGRDVRKQLIRYLSGAELSMPIAILSQSPKGVHMVQEFTTDRQTLLDAASGKHLLDSEFEPSDAVPGRFNLPIFLAGIPGRVNLIRFTSNAEGGGLSNADMFLRDASGRAVALRIGHVALYTIHSNYFSGERLGARGGDIYLDNGGFAGSGLGNSSFAGTNTGGRPRPLETGVVGAGSGAGVGTTMGGKTFDDGQYATDLAEVMSTGAHYYTLSYTPTDQRWEGEFRDVHLDVPGYTVSSPSLWSRIIGKDEDTKVEYRRGYFATKDPGLNPDGSLRGREMFPELASKNAGSDPDRPVRTLLSSSGKKLQISPRMMAAMRFGTSTPVQLPFTVTVSPSSESVDAKAVAFKPNNFLNPHFQAKSYRSYHIHYTIKPTDLTFKENAGSFMDNLRFVTILYTDDGFEVNSLATPGSIRRDAEGYRSLMQGPLSFDQTIAVPTTGYFYLRIGVREFSSDHIGVIEVPIDSSNVSLRDEAADGSSKREQANR
jgi:hypothetical protein